MEAVTTKHNDLIGLLIEHRADPRLTDADGHTAADLAKASGNDEAIGSLTGP
jgi:ankyrin repeat protein